MRLTRTLLLTLSLASGTLLAQTQFRTVTDAIVIDVSVHDKARRPVRGLTAEDFEVLENGQPRPIISVRFVDVETVETSGAPWTSRVPVDAQDNDLASRRLFVLLLDDTSWLNVVKSQEFAHAFIDRLGPDDLAAVLFVGIGGQPQEFTMDRGRLHRAVDTLKVAGLSQRFGGLESLRKLSHALAALPDRRKVVVYLSAGAEFDTDLLSASFNAGNIEAIAAQSKIFRDMQAYIREAQRANVNVYSVDLNGLRAPSADSSDPGRARREFMQVVADETGGRAIINNNEPLQEMSHILEENDSYYVLGFTPSAASERDRFRRITVRVKQREVSVRSRLGYVMPGSVRSSVTDQNMVDGKTMPAWLPDPRVPMQIVSAPLRNGGKSSAIITVASTLTAAGTSARERVTVRLQAFDFNNRSVAVQEASLQLASPAAGRVFQTQFVLPLPPGRYRLHATTHAVDRSLQGTLGGDVVVPNFEKEPMSMSGIVLHHNRAPVSVSIDALKALEPAVPAIPTAERVFPPADDVTAWMRVYKGVAPATVRASIRDRQDREVFARETVLAAEAAAGPGTDWSLRLPLATLPTGDYLLTLDVTQAGKPPAQRMVRFTVS
jgi:VWFA-related protein